MKLIRRINLAMPAFGLSVEFFLAGTAPDLQRVSDVRLAILAIGDFCVIRRESLNSASSDG